SERGRWPCYDSLPLSATTFESVGASLICVVNTDVHSIGRGASPVSNNNCEPIILLAVHNSGVRIDLTFWLSSTTAPLSVVAAMPASVVQSGATGMSTDSYA